MCRRRHVEKLVNCDELYALELWYSKDCTIAEIIAETNLDIKFLRHGLKDIFTTSGPYRELLEYYQLDPKGIHDTALQLFD